MKQEYKRNRHVNPKRLMLLILIPVLLLAGGFGIYKIMAEDAYAAYNTYDESNKKEGTMEHFTEEKEDTYYLSFYYPKFEDKQLNEIVQTYRSTSNRQSASMKACSISRLIMPVKSCLISM